MTTSRDGRRITASEIGIRGETIVASLQYVSADGRFLAACGEYGHSNRSTNRASDGRRRSSPECGSDLPSSAQPTDVPKSRMGKLQTGTPSTDERDKRAELPKNAIVHYRSRDYDRNDHGKSGQGNRAPTLSWCSGVSFACSPSSAAHSRLSSGRWLSPAVRNPNPGVA